MKNGRTEVRIAGAGGQGVVTAGRILAEAALLSGRYATHSQVYGPQSRGGASRSDVVISDEAIGFPLTESLDVLVAVSTAALERYGADMDADTLLVVDEDAQGAPGGAGAGRTFAIVEAARRIVGTPVATGVVALGVLTSLTELVKPSALSEAVAARVPAARREANLAALEAGVAMGREQ